MTHSKPVQRIPLRRRGPKPEDATPAQWRDEQFRQRLKHSMTRATTKTRWYVFAVKDANKTLYWAYRLAEAGVSVSVPERASWRGVNGTVKGKREYIVQPFRPYVFVGVSDTDQLKRIVQRFYRSVRLQVDARRRPVNPRDIRRLHKRLGCQPFEPGGPGGVPSAYWDGILDKPEVEITAGWLADMRGRVDRIEGDVARLVLDASPLGMTNRIRVPLSDLRRVNP